MTIPYTPKVNQRAIGAELIIVNETHIVGITSIATSNPNQIRLIEVPLQESPSSVAIPGFTEVLGAPGTNEYKVDYTNGRITFNSAHNGDTVFVTYKGRGSLVDAEDINELQVPLGSISNITGELTSGIVHPTNISTVATDDFTFPRHVVVTGDLTVNGTTTTVESTTVTIADNILLLDSNVTGAPTLDSGFQVHRGSSPDVQLIWNETDDAWSLKNTSGVSILEAFDTGNVTINLGLSLNGQIKNSDGTVSAPAYSFSSETNTGLYRSGLNSLSTSINGVEKLTLTSSSLNVHLLPVKNLVIESLSSDPGSPTTGQVWFNTVTNQFKGYNGTSIVLIG